MTLADTPHPLDLPYPQPQDIERVLQQVCQIVGKTSGTCDKGAVLGVVSEGFHEYGILAILSYCEVVIEDTQFGGSSRRTFALDIHQHIYTFEGARSPEAVEKTTYMQTLGPMPGRKVKSQHTRWQVGTRSQFGLMPLNDEFEQAILDCVRQDKITHDVQVLDGGCEQASAPASRVRL